MSLNFDSPIGQLSAGVILGVIATPAIAMASEVTQEMDLTNCEQQNYMGSGPVDCRCVCENTRKPKTVRLMRRPSAMLMR